MTVGIDAVVEVIGLGTPSIGTFVAGLTTLSPGINTRIRSGDELILSDGSVFIAGTGGNNQDRNRASDDLTQVGNVATMVTTADHGYVSGIIVTTEDAIEPEYNVIEVEITVTSPNSFTYPISGSPSSPATHGGGGFVVLSKVVEVEVTSVLVGESQNRPAGTLMELEIVRGDMQSSGRLLIASTGGLNPEDDPNPSFYDIKIGDNGDILTDDSFDTAILMSVFEEVRATAKEVPASQLRRGWLGNESTPNFEQGSKAWTFEQERITGSILSELGPVIRNGLQWFIDDDLLLNVIVEQPLLLAGRVGVFANLYRDGSPVDRRFFELWDNTGR